jgi:hypothetical protein
VNQVTRRALGDLGVDGKIIIEWGIKKQGMEAWIDLIWLKTWTNGGLM